MEKSTFKMGTINKTWKIHDSTDWEILLPSFDWLQDMVGVKQDAIYHAEGDVANHTKMVLEALLQLPEYVVLEEQQQAILVAAVLLHDVEKRSTTVIEEDGRITSKGHALKGSFTARKILYQEHATPFLVREVIVKLVRYHGLPIWFLEKRHPAKAVIQASLEVDTTLLYILAKADMLGRICKDQADMLDRVELFKEFCKEQDCFGQAKAFPSDWGRYLYFYKEDGSLEYVPYEKDSFEVILLSGLPGTGKDAHIREHYKDVPMVSIGALRRQHKVLPTNKKKNGQMIQLAKEEARTHLRIKQPFVWNATNITQNMRRQMIDLFQTYGAKTKLVYLEVPYKQLLKQNRNREYMVPEKVIHRMIQKLEVPVVWEAPIVEYPNLLPQG